MIGNWTGQFDELITSDLYDLLPNPIENPRRGRQARNLTTNVPKILDLKSPSEQIFPKIVVGCP